MNLVYNASAGTGKTYQVTQLYAKLVIEDRIDPREILLMTFTENAAAELRMRVTHRLLQARKSAEANGDDELVETAIEAMSRLASAPIGTIHSYCTRLLREHALDAGLSPGFSVLVDDERDELLERVCRDELLDRLETDPDFKGFCSGVRIMDSKQGFGGSIMTTMPDLIGQAGSLNVSLEDAEHLLQPPLPPIPLADFQAIHRQLVGLGKRTPKIDEAIAILGECLEAAIDARDLVDRFEATFSGHFSYGDAKTIYPEFKALKEEARARECYRERYPFALAFARFVQAVAQRFQRSKHEANAVDFDDLLRIATKLLHSGKAKPAFRHIIVDEVQDTSRIQCDLIQSLWQNDTRLVICGDKKQSIYTWRGADPQVMPDLEKAILAAGGTTENLQTSFRSKATILDVVNTLFASVYGPDGYSENDRLQPSDRFPADGEKSCVEFLLPDGNDDQSSRLEKVEAEMAAVARRIQLLVHGGREWQPAYRYNDGFEPTSGNNGYRYSDVLILLRRMTHLPALEQALRHASIPFTLGGKGRGLFTRQETRDVSLFLNVLANPSDALSLVGFLRSPWVGLTDDAIAELAWHEGAFSVDHLLARHAERTDLIDRYRNLLGTRLASELVRMLIDETGYDALLAGLPRGTQRLANLRKVLDWLREAERGAHTTPAAVARKLADMVAHPPQVPEAALLDPAQNSVTIMTVHAAKGLTQRVVFIPDCSFSDQSDRGFAQIHVDQGKPILDLRISSPDKSSVKTPLFDEAIRAAAETRKHESNNLFYVAMTRARDLVVASASIGEKPNGWLKLMETLIGTGISTVSYESLAAADSPLKPDVRHPDTGTMQAALDTLPPPPAPPVLFRIPATRLAQDQDQLERDPETDGAATIPTGPSSAALGSLGHAVLEQLAWNGWQGSVPDWLERLREDFALEQRVARSLEDRIEQVRILMAGETARAEVLHPEFPFVLHDGERLIDGTIDLLCKTARGFAIFDYKFTNSPERDVLQQYRGQMEIYRRAAERLFPQAIEKELRLVVVSAANATCIPVLF